MQLPSNEQENLASPVEVSEDISSPKCIEEIEQAPVAETVEHVQSAKDTPPVRKRDRKAVYKVKAKSEKVRRIRRKVDF